MQVNTPNILSKQNEVLHQVGQPLNRVAEVLSADLGSPIYCISNLSYQSLYPFIDEYAYDRHKLSQIWEKASHDIEEFYLHAYELENVPVWKIDEMALNAIRDKQVREYIANHDDTKVCYLDRVVPEYFNSLRLQINRTLPIEDGIVVRNDRPSIIAERPGQQTVNRQLRSIALECKQEGIKKILLADSGFASGNTMLKVCRWIEEAGLSVEKLIGGVGSYPMSYEALKQYDPECAIWFDLQRSGWVEGRDYFTFLNAGTPISQIEELTGHYRIATTYLDSGQIIGFTVPYIAYGGRWFRLGDPNEIKRLMQKCFKHSLELYNAIKPEATIGDLASLFEKNGMMFLLPINFGDLSMERNLFKSTIKIEDHLQQHFQRFLQ